MTKEVAVADWKEALGKQVAVAQEQAKMPDTNGTPHISLKHGRMTLNDVAFPGDEVQCLILASSLERTWYDRPYDPDDIGPPECFALGATANSLTPHENVKTPPSNTCKACPMAEFGTARQGKGPACKTKLRLVIMPIPTSASDVIIADAEVAILKVSPTSVVNFNGTGAAGKPPGYAVLLADQGVTPWAVISKVMVRPHNKKMHEVTFELIKPLAKDSLLQAAYTKSVGAEEIVLQPYVYEDDDDISDEVAAAALPKADGARY